MSFDNLLRLTSYSRQGRPGATSALRFILKPSNHPSGSLCSVFFIAEDWALCAFSRFPSLLSNLQDNREWAGSNHGPSRRKCRCPLFELYDACSYLQGHIHVGQTLQKSFAPRVVTFLSKNLIGFRKSSPNDNVTAKLAQ